MKTHDLYGRLVGYIVTTVFVALIAGCGGGSGNTATSGGTPPTAVEPAVTADPGRIIAVRVGQVANLDGSRSTTTTTNTLSFAWSFSSKPDGSTAVLQNSTSPTPSFVTDVTGTYRIQLVVSAGNLTSQRTIALVEVTNPGDYLTGLRDHTSFTSQCADCHDGRFDGSQGPIDPVPTKIGLHPSTSNLCQGCHTTFGFNLLPAVDHLEVFENCSTCHNNDIAIGKSEFHQVTAGECSECHNTDSFLNLLPDGTFDHTGVTSGCVRCHNGQTAIGKTSSIIHDNTTSDCSACHTTTAFAPAYPDHTDTAVTSQRCDACHNPGGGGVNATDQPAGHPVMTRVDTTVEDCGTCHSINGFNMGGVYPHRLIDPTVLTCSTCHDVTNSINAPGKASAPTPPGHVVTTTDCASCHSTVAFSPAFNIDHTDPTVVAQACNACHVPAGGGSAQGLSVNHMPYDTVNVDCETCHAPPGGGTFATGFYDHSGVTNGCQTCHNDVITAGKTQNHIPTTPADQDCVVCHAASIPAFTSFTGAVFAHTGITNNCQTCHNGTFSTGKSTNHIPTTPVDQDCSACHMAGTFVDFTDGYFDHTGVNTNCASCHNGNYVSSGAIPKKVNHIPAQQECSQCHLDATVTGGFMTTIFYSNVHTNLANGCEGCHNTLFFPATPTVVKVSTTHVPTAQDCHFCHVNTIPGGFTLGMSIFAHTGISGNCVSCHDGSAKNVAVGARGKTSTPTHDATTADCSACHNTTNFADAYPDHFGPQVVGRRCDSCHGVTATGKISGHVPVPVVSGVEQDCAVCHVPGTFTPSVFNHTGITNNCASCHDGSVSAVTVKPGNHPPTIVNGVDRDCSYCHNTTAFAGARYDHTGITNNCVSCHNGNPIIGKNGNHVPTTSDCSICHQTTGFIPATFNHTPTQINGKRCDACHNGTFATGKIDDPTPPHLTTTQDCGFCHSFNQPFSAAIFDHTGITSGCNASGCHTPTGDGRYYVTPPHVDPAGDCIACHAVDGAFLDGQFDHTGVTPGTCANSSCHGPGGTGTQQPPNGPNGHFATNGVSCDACHTTATWLNQNTFDHCPGSTANNNACTITSTGGWYPGDHRAGKTTCKSCHTTNVATVVSYPNQATHAPACAGCHAGDFRRKDKHIGGSNGTVAQNKDCSGGGRGCHRVNDNGFD